MTDLPPDLDLPAIERAAAELADMAGARIRAALGRSLSVRYKSNPDADTLRDPVSEVDEAVEEMIRRRVSEQFPDHDVVGEESDARPGLGHDVVWAVDPVDGTTNFVNGFPLFAASIGVLWRGRPVAGALWCSTSHALRAGVYHARRGGPLQFEFEPTEMERNPMVRRRLAGLGSGLDATGRPWDARKTGSAAVECAFVAAGLLGAARFDRPNVWDVAGGVCLVEAAGGRVLTGGADGWTAFDGFLPAAPDGDLRRWTRPMILGAPDMVAEIEAVG